MHEPQTECIAKGKVHRRYELGVKAGYVTASKSNWVLGAMALPDYIIPNVYECEAAHRIS